MNKDLEKAIVSVLIGEKKVLTAKQQQIDVHEPEKDELTAKDFEMLRAGKKAKQVKEEQVDEVAPIVAAAGRVLAGAAGAAARAASTPTGKKIISTVAQQAAMAAVDKAAKKFAGDTAEKEETNEEAELDEAGMPSSVARHKQNLKNMSDKEFANHPHYGKMDDKQLRSMAWSHGYGGPGTRGHDTYVDKKKRGLQTESTDNGEVRKTVGPDLEGKEMLRRDNEARKRNMELVNSIAADIKKKQREKEEGIGEQVNEAFDDAPHYDKIIRSHKDKNYGQIAKHYGEEKTKEHINSLKQERDTLIKKHKSIKAGMMHDQAIKGLKAGLKSMQVKVEEVESVEEGRFKKGQDVGKPGMNFAKISKSAAARYGSKEAGQRVAGAVLKKVLAKEDISYTFNDYLNAAREKFGDEAAVKIANEAYNNNDTSLFSNDSEA